MSVNNLNKKQQKFSLQMNRQYLKSLQQRAQRLLQVSSEQEQQEQQNFNITKAKSRRVDLNEVLSNTDVNQLKNQFEDYRNTDVELLKRCINLTSQNTELKRQLKQFDTEKSQLKAQNTYLQNELQNYKIQLTRIKERQSRKQTGSESPFNKLQQVEHFSFIERNPAQSMKQKSQSMSKFASSKYSQQNEQSSNLKQIQRIEQRYSRQIAQLQQRLKVANQKKENLELILIKQKQKANKLWKFINQQIPQLKDVVTSLTNKVDVHVQSILLKDVNQQEVNMRLMKRKDKHVRHPY